MRGPCAKRRVTCVIFTNDDERFEGENDCANPQVTCPRQPREGYEKCKTICQQAGHAELEALKAAGEKARGADALLYGHYWVCEPCGAAMRAAGIHSIKIITE